MKILYTIIAMIVFMNMYTAVDNSGSGKIINQNAVTSIQSTVDTKSKLISTSQSKAAKTLDTSTKQRTVTESTQRTHSVLKQTISHLIEQIIAKTPTLSISQENIDYIDISAEIETADTKTKAVNKMSYCDQHKHIKGVTKQEQAKGKDVTIITASTKHHGTTESRQNLIKSSKLANPNVLTIFKIQYPTPRNGAQVADYIESKPSQINIWHIYTMRLIKRRLCWFNKMMRKVKNLIDHHKNNPTLRAILLEQILLPALSQYYDIYKQTHDFIETVSGDKSLITCVDGMYNADKLIALIKEYVESDAYDKVIAATERLKSSLDRFKKITSQASLSQSASYVNHT